MIRTVLTIRTSFEWIVNFEKGFFFFRKRYTSLRTRNPSPPVMIRNDSVKLIPVLDLKGSNPLLKIENPALQKAEIE